MRVVAIFTFQVQRKSRVDRQRTHELDRQAGVILPAHRLRHGCVEHQIRAAGDIQCAEAERLVHRHECLPKPRDARLVAQTLGNRLPEHDAAVLDRVMAVDLQIALAADAQAKAAVYGKGVKHMVEKADAGIDLAVAAVQIKRQRDIGFLGLACDFSLSHPLPPPQSAPRPSLRARPDAHSAPAQ